MSTVRKKSFFQRQINLLKKESIWYLFLAPTLVTIACLSIYPLIRNLVLSFYSSRNGSCERFIGLLNYRWVLGDPDFWNALYNTLYIGAFSLAINLPLSFILACVIHSQRRSKNLFRTLYFLPNLTATTAVSMIFLYLFYPTQAGIINSLLTRIGLPSQGWLTDPSTSKWVIIMMDVWRCTGYNIVIWMAGLQSIPEETYEAATIDGADTFQKWRYITIPLSKSIFAFMVITGTMNALKRFNDCWALGDTGGGPLHSFQTLVLYFFDRGMYASQYGIGAAAAMLIFILIITVTIINLRLTNGRKKI